MTTKVRTLVLSLAFLLSAALASSPAQFRVLSGTALSSTVTWTGTSSGSQNVVATPTLAFTAGTYTLTVNRTTTLTFKGAAGGGLAPAGEAGCGALCAGNGGGGGGGGGVTNGTTTQLIPGRTYTLVIGSTHADTTLAGSVEGAMVTLGSGVSGAGTGGGAGGPATVGSNLVPGSAGGAANSGAGAANASGAAGGGAGGFGDNGGGSQTNGGGGGTGSGGAGAAGGAAGPGYGGGQGGQGGGASFAGVGGTYGAGAGGGGGGNEPAGAGNAAGAAQAGIGVFSYVSAP